MQIQMTCDSKAFNAALESLRELCETDAETARKAMALIDENPEALYEIDAREFPHTVLQPSAALLDLISPRGGKA